MTRDNSAARGQVRAGWPWLALTFLLAFVSSGRFAVPLAPWLQPVFALRFARGHGPLRGYAMLVAALWVPNMVGWWGVQPFPPPVYYVSMLVTVAVAALPVLADRLLAHRVGGLAGTLVFPLAATALEFALMSTNPLGSFGASAYTQYPNLALIQLVSLTGLWGLTFLISWPASIANLAWERGTADRQVRRAAELCAATLAGVLLYGGLRLALPAADVETVRVAGVTSESVDMSELMALLESDREGFRDRTRAAHARYLDDTAREADAGARIVVWPELAGIGVQEDVLALIERAGALARDRGIHLAVPVFVLHDDERPAVNELLLIGPDGEVGLRHVKFGGNMFEGSQVGDGVVRALASEHGGLAGVICWDTDFPAAVRRAEGHVDILLSPSHEWRAIDPMHAEMAVFRAIENGVSVFRQADLGRSIAVDPLGRVLAATDHFTSPDRTLVAQLPVRGVTTFYSLAGDWFGWLAVAGLAGLVGLAWLRPSPSQSSPEA